MQNLHFLCQTLILFAKAVQFCRISFLTPLRFSRAKRLNLKPLSFQLSACYSKLLGYAALRCARLIKPINGACFKLVSICSSMLSHLVPLSWTGVKYPNDREQAQSSPCALLGVSRSTLLRLSKAKKLNKIRISSKRVGWSRSDLLRFIADFETHNITMTQT